MTGYKGLSSKAARGLLLKVMVERDENR